MRARSRLLSLASVRAFVAVAVVWCVVMGAVRQLVGCWSVPGEGCRDPGPVNQIIRIRLEPALASSTITTVGACPPPSCVEPLDGGCLEWRSTATGEAGAPCHLIVNGFDRGILYEARSCEGETMGGDVTITIDGGVQIWPFSPGDASD